MSKKEPLRYQISLPKWDDMPQPSKRLLFSDRYKNFDKTNYLVKVVDNVKKQILSVLEANCAPTLEKPSKYDSWTITRVTSDYVLADLYEKHQLDGIPNLSDEIISHDEVFLFDALESWNYHINDADFAVEINNVFESNDLPFRLCDGKIIKIDSEQFEQDLTQKHIKELQELQTIEPAFHNAYKELVEAIENYDKCEYDKSIEDAAKSYESIIKIVSNKHDGQAEGNIRESLKLDLFKDLPLQINKDGFKDNVLMSLPYIRNKTQSGHGKGSNNIVIPKSLAKLAINLCCTLSAYYIQLFREEKHDK